MTAGVRLGLVIIAMCSVLTGLGHAQATDVQPLQKRAEQGDADAQFRLGRMYDLGEGWLDDDAEAVKWYRLAAEQGRAVAQYILGQKYEWGFGVPQDIVEAVKWYRLAAEQGNADAQLTLGARYAEGGGVPENAVEAFKWYSLAAAQGEKQASENKEILSKTMTPDQIAEAQRLSAEWRPKQ
jgi:TPR repeat protein